MRAAFESVAQRQSAEDRLKTEAIIVILEDKRDEVMARREAGYFIHVWQEFRTQVRDLIMQDSRYQAIR